MAFHTTDARQKNIFKIDLIMPKYTKYGLNVDLSFVSDKTK